MSFLLPGGTLAAVDARVDQLHLSDRDEYLNTLVEAYTRDRPPLSGAPLPDYPACEHVTATIPIPLASILLRRAHAIDARTPGLLRSLVLADLAAARRREQMP
ncbi:MULTISPECIES: hypothetical protein [unclassified Cellulomonas]|uniref:hypothetical protein n=1 Tax=unclassified Cellulomonas TaxID=2620175 RepID=UPI001C4E765B|nr:MULTISPECIES: hypothetical protein [unclassified Cellulomonas]MBW0254490.1 hypothetical protein [Cellulomonas sp. PS-H5]MCG7284717.1 hypothetical protein [Cellulomonas sp. ACRRI]